jgi:hypothetical protein
VSSEKDPALIDDEATAADPVEADGDARKMTLAKAERVIARNQQLRDKMMRISEHRDHLRSELERILPEYETLRRSYYLSGHREKTDISELPTFSQLAKAVIDEGRSGMNFDRLYTLWQAVSRAPDGYPAIEVGSYKGGSAKFIAGALQATQTSPRFYVCDTFQGHAQVDAEIDGPNAAKGFTETSAEAVSEYLSGYPFIELVVGDIMETSARLTESAYGFVHIDVDVYPPTAFCLKYFSQRLAPGAWMIVDDYGVVTCPGAQKAVDDFVREHADFSKVHLLTGQAVLFRAG